jgi:hypothetical protein
MPPGSPVFRSCAFTETRPSTTAVTYGNSETECKRLLAAAIAAGGVDADAKPSKLVYANGQWQIMA